MSGEATVSCLKLGKFCYKFSIDMMITMNLKVVVVGPEITLAKILD